MADLKKYSYRRRCHLPNRPSVPMRRGYTRPEGCTSPSWVRSLRVYLTPPRVHSGLPRTGVLVTAHLSHSRS
ncbi:unnamed protein product [Nesidiocoris tenuis]|uniref:Uncharacterized protein n=1 Tax=Nesidiocoris tenuis TaxID=355587 RepID=A0A6H5HNM4_9HEMI|nr:unnamed protein product [Nesidiocoris tenuis]